MDLLNVYFLSFFVFLRVDSVPPEACFANFRWDDCGLSPTPVMYYWKPGSRCEVGLWRGCLPNLNMFQDEYECVTTCIFTERAMPEDYHSINNVESDIDVYDLTTESNIENANSTDTTMAEDIGDVTNTINAVSDSDAVSTTKSTSGDNEATTDNVVTEVANSEATATPNSE